MIYKGFDLMTQIITHPYLKKLYLILFSTTDFLSSILEIH